MSSRRGGRVLRHVVMSLVGIAMFFLAACGTYVPSGSTVVKVTNMKQKLDRADLYAKNELAGRHVIKMKWYDTNTFITSNKMNGVYAFRARSYDGAAVSRDITMTPEEDYYEIDAGTKTASAAKTVSEAKVKGRVRTGLGSRRDSGKLAVLFIGREVVMRSATADKNGAFSVDAPADGTYKIEVHALGDSPLSYTHPPMKIVGPIDLGEIVLR